MLGIQNWRKNFGSCFVCLLFKLLKCSFSRDDAMCALPWVTLWCIQVFQCLFPEICALSWNMCTFLVSLFLINHLSGAQIPQCIVNNKQHSTIMLLDIWFNYVWLNWKPIVKFWHDIEISWKWNSYMQMFK